MLVGAVVAAATPLGVASIASGLLQMTRFIRYTLSKLTPGGDRRGGGVD